MTRIHWGLSITAGVAWSLVGMTTALAQARAQTSALIAMPTPAWPTSTWAAAIGVAVVMTGLVGASIRYARMRSVLAATERAEALSAQRRREAEEALRVTERQVQQLVHSLKAIVWRRDLASGRYMFVSQEAEQLLGYPVSRWTEHIGFAEALIHPGDREWVRGYSQRAAADCRDHTMEYRVLAQDGRLVWLRDIVSVMRNSGQARELIGVMVDISEYKAAEAALESAHAQALSATRVKSEFLASMSHEIRTPMNAVIGIADLLLDTPLNAEQRQLVETVRSSGDVLIQVINDILDFSKVESGKLEFEQIALDPERLADDVARLMGEAAITKGLELTCRIDPGVPGNLIGDPGRLRQVLLNLVGNAVKFTERGDVTIYVSASEVTDASAVVRVEVSDTGIGISSHAQSRLFDDFTQAEASTARRFGGTGLGLAISRRIVELLGGRIGVESVSGEGTTFWFTVPCARAGAEMPLPESGPGRGMRALVVDGSHASRLMLEQTLLDAGLRVQAVGSAAAAMDVIEPDAWPHVVLIDEGIDGGAARLAEHLRTRAAHPLTVLLLSSRPAAQAVSTDRTSRLMKPVRRSELLEALGQIGQPDRRRGCPDDPAARGRAGTPAALRACWWPRTTR